MMTLRFIFRILNHIGFAKIFTVIDHFDPNMLGTTPTTSN